MCTTSDEAVKITAFLRLGCAPQCTVERQVSTQGTASVFVFCTVKVEYGLQSTM